MNRILSWKIKSGVYAYIHIPNSTSHISKRIPENSPLWDEIISVISSWKKDEYKSNFQEMAFEIRQRYGKNIEWDDKYWNFVDENSFGGVNIVMLAGQEGDGDSGGSSTPGGDNDTDGDGVDDGIADAFAQFDAMIDAELAAMRAAVDEKNNAVKAQIEASVQNTVAEAKKEIAETQAELEATNKRLTEDLNSAKDAMEKASALFELGEGNITAEDIQEVISNVNDYSRWVTDLSGNVVDLKSDYDSTVSAITSMGMVEDVKHGLFSHFATTINTTASATGHVERWMASISGVVQDMAKWYTDDSVTEAIRYINASSGIIQDTINYVHGDDTNSLNRTMDAKNALILDEAKSYVQDVSGSITTSVYAKMDGLRGEIEESINKAKEDINGNQESIVSLGRRMDATDESIEQWITSTNELSGTAMDLRDRWDTISGMVRSVSNMIVRTDENGNQLGYIEMNGVKRDVVKIGQAWYLMDTNEPVDSKEVVPYYSYSIGSYISQTANEAIMSVVDDTGKTAAIRAAISGDTALIGLVADKIVMDADVVMGALSAKTATIGGIQIGKGKITTINDYDQYGHEFGVPGAFVLDGNTGGFSAMNAYIHGTIDAQKGNIGGFSIENNILEVKSYDISTNKMNTISFLNGSNDFKYAESDDNGIIFGAGVETSVTYYCYDFLMAVGESGYKEYSNPIYFPKKYNEQNLNNGTIVKGYTLNKTSNGNGKYNYEIIPSTRVFFIADNIDSSDKYKKYIIETNNRWRRPFINVLEQDIVVTGSMVDIKTKIYSNGVIETERLECSDGIFNGEITAYGKLYDSDIEECDIKNSNIYLTNNDIFNVSNITELSGHTVSDEYFLINGTKMSPSIGERKMQSRDMYYYVQNKSTKRNVYNFGYSFINHRVYKGDKLDIPSIIINISRFCGNKYNGNGSVDFIITRGIISLDGKRKHGVVSKSYSHGGNGSDDSTSVKITDISANNLIVDEDGYLYIEINGTANVGPWGFRGYSTTHVYNNAFVVNVTSDEIESGTYIAPNGFRTISDKMAQLSVVDDAITMTSSNGKYGIKIDDKGIQLYKDGNWTYLLQ